MPEALTTACSLMDEFSSRGLRITNQRRVLLEILQSTTGQLNATQLLALAQDRDQGVNRATVYRTLEILKNLGLITGRDLMTSKGEKRNFEIRSRRDHINLACFGCGCIQEFQSELLNRLKAEIAARENFNICAVRMEVCGRCMNCATVV